MPIEDLIQSDIPLSARCWCGGCIGNDSHVCPTCATPYHSECWDSIEGCATYGCKERGKVLDELALEFEIPGVSDSEIVIRDDRAVAKSDHVGARLLSWYSAIRRRVGLRDDSWIDGYLDKVRKSLSGVAFTPISADYLSPGGAIEYCNSHNARLVSAGECGLARVLDDCSGLGDEYTCTFAFCFRKGGKLFVAYDDVSHDDWLYLMDNRRKTISADDPVVARGLKNAGLRNRVVLANPTACSVLSCVPDLGGGSVFTRDKHSLAIFGRAVQPYGLWLYRKLSVGSLNLWTLPCLYLEKLSDQQVYALPVGLGGGDVGVNDVNASVYYYDGRARAGSVVAQKIGEVLK